ncbi:MAG: M20/M25/M40 family metallo-hydrolase, partial [Synergistaceae bacterium]|nr:M20/M25/M40 family metallo-hydrolase [Synergistaceae bacterium]
MLREKIIELVTSLVAIDSSNAFLIPGSPGERGVQEFMACFLERNGIGAALEPVGGCHANLVASLKGRGGGRNLTLYAHADTVGYELWGDRALKAKIDRDGDRMTGLGAADDKGHCAAAMLAVIELARGGGLDGDVNIAIVADEEGKSAGAMNYVKRHAPEAVLVLEAAPIEQINITHQGFGWLDIVVKGRAAH